MSKVFSEHGDLYIQDKKYNRNDMCITAHPELINSTVSSSRMILLNLDNAHLTDFNV